MHAVFSVPYNLLMISHVPLRVAPLVMLIHSQRHLSADGKMYAHVQVQPRWRKSWFLCRMQVKYYCNELDILQNM